jgi:hypothetical protein
MVLMMLTACGMVVEHGGLPPEPVANRPDDAEGDVTETFLTDGIHHEYFLSRIPDPSTIEVTLYVPDGEWQALDGESGPGMDYVLDPGRNSVTVFEVPPPDHILEVDYVVASE